ncbi:MAG: DUF4136 domain-containing protein [Rhodoferax sp.]|nr:DUF4136 domain-containing protein [Rhodoferax sp.]
MLCAAVLLSGCALPRMIDSEVQSFAGSVPAATGASYRFDRLPSQANNPAQDQVEAMTADALANAGLKRDDAAPRYLVQVDLGVEGMRNPYYRPPRSRLVLGNNGLWYEQPLFPDLESPWYRHRVHLLLRETSSGQVAYETSATFEGPWSDTLNLLPPILEAALQDYPAPGTRKVVVELPGHSAGPR